MKKKVFIPTLFLMIPLSLIQISCDDDNESNTNSTRLYSNAACMKSKLPHPHFIDLALPSGTLWACCNLGASGTTDEGVKYAWGETSVKDSTYCWKNYLFYNTEKGLCERIGNSGSIVGTDYDAAMTKWGQSYRMPSESDWSELLKYCTVSVENTNNGKAMITFKGKNNSTITLPIDESHGYWTSDQNRLGHDNYALALIFQPTSEKMLAISPVERCLDLHIRPIASFKYSSSSSVWGEE